MNIVYHASSSRGAANFGWLDSKHTFSFGEYFNPERVNFGKLRVLNDDTVAPGKGFGTHPHRDMEIVSIPLSGSLMHKDSEGNEQLIRKGEVQIMSAGTGVYHSEFNASLTEEVKFLQIWIMPKNLAIHPRYEQKKFEFQLGEWTNVVSPLEHNLGGVKVNQDAFFSMIHFDKQEINYSLKAKGNGIYLFIVAGSIVIEGKTYSLRDGVGITDLEQISITSNEYTELLVIEIPMQA
ncbi:MAG: pirin family protein [Bacteriovoracaceae bacterium]|nr:pirin family protein [Bacteriovoracaceae bacterium]